MKQSSIEFLRKGALDAKKIFMRAPIGSKLFTDSVKDINHFNRLLIDRHRFIRWFGAIVPMEQSVGYDPFTSMFNCHMNNALDKTIIAYIQIWGYERFRKVIRPYLDRGVMSIFDHPPRRDTKFFVSYNHQIVTGKRII